MGVGKTYKNTSTILTTATWLIDPTGEQGGTKDYMKKYVPFNGLFVSNDDSNTVEVYPNGFTERRLVLAQGATRNLILEPFNFLILKNIGSGTVAANTLVVRISKELTK